MNYKHLLIAVFLLLQGVFKAQSQVTGIIVSEKNKPIRQAQIYNSYGSLLAETDSKGYFEFFSDQKQITVFIYSENFKLKELSLNVSISSNYQITLEELSEELSEIQLKARQKKIFELKRLKDVVGTAIYAGKKTEVILVDQSLANLASNNARQIFGQVPGLNIFQNDDAGLQLNIGGRGLDPNRTSNFNTRQNGYDISADVLGYPESYYTPASEALQEIQIIRGAASLQYGTQFGGLVNFVIKSPNRSKVLEVTTRNTLGSYHLRTNFTSISGMKNKLSYYSYINYKKGKGFRPNSAFQSKNFFLNLSYDLDSTSKISAEITHLDYIAQQAGGLSDQMFATNPLQSNRERNWFKVDWFLYHLNWYDKLSEETSVSLNFFGLNASRKSVGYRVRRVDLPDTGEARELLIGDFNNVGLETRLLSSYDFMGEKVTFLVGSKIYSANNYEHQGPGSQGSDPDFTKSTQQFPNYRIRGNFKNPNLNAALFSEHILYFSDKFSIIPGFRFEYIKTKSQGMSKTINFDGAGNPIGDQESSINQVKERSFVLLGLGLSFKPFSALEVYGNVSENYRSITFSDVNIVNPSNAIDPNLSDEKGWSVDFGARGILNNWISYDIGFFGLFYKDRIGFVYAVIPPVNNLGQLRKNVGDAQILGIESLFDFNLSGVLGIADQFNLNYFINTSIVDSEYSRAATNGIKGNKIEFVPDINLKTGLRFGYDNFTSSIQYTYLSNQFSDAENSFYGDVSGIVGVIPSYDIVDVSAAYTHKFIKLETGINNLLNNRYFTRRATGYPGPGIIPSIPRNWYLTVELKF